MDREQEMRELVGDPRVVAREMEASNNDLKAFFSEEKRLLQQYPQQWVVFYDGKVQAHAPTHEAVLKEVEKRGLPKGRVIIQFLDKSERPLIV